MGSTVGKTPKQIKINKNTIPAKPTSLTKSTISKRPQLGSSLEKDKMMKIQNKVQIMPLPTLYRNISDPVSEFSKLTNDNISRKSGGSSTSSKSYKSSTSTNSTSP